MSSKSNAEILEDLFQRDAIAIRRGEIFDKIPASPAAVGWDRIEGMVLGLAIGDALGNTSESLVPAARAARYGEIRDYLPNRHAAGRRIGLPSDDTQMALWTLESLLEAGGLSPDALARKFCSGQIYGIGSTVREFIRNHSDRGLPWFESGPASAGNGALMRIAPVLIPNFSSRSRDLWVDTALAAMLTRNDTASIASCMAFVSLLLDLMAMAGPPPADWWVEAFLAVVEDLDTGAVYGTRGGRYSDYTGTFPAFVRRVLADARSRSLRTVEAADEWCSGAYLLETLPSVLYILACHADDPEEAIVRAVNDTRDNDTVAAIVGAAVGALHGVAALPARWVDGLSGRTRASDDGRLWQLLDGARAAFGPPLS